MTKRLWRLFLRKDERKYEIDGVKQERKDLRQIIRAGRYIEHDDHAQLVSKAGSVIGGKSPLSVISVI